MIGRFPEPADTETPMLYDSLQRMREPCGSVLTDRVPDARSIVGLGLFVVRGARPDGLFAVIAVSQHIANNLSPYVWECVLRWAYYLVHTKHFRLVFRPPRIVNGFPRFRANSDSSCINCVAGDGGGGRRCTRRAGMRNSKHGRLLSVFRRFGCCHCRVLLAAEVRGQLGRL